MLQFKTTFYSVFTVYKCSTPSLVTYVLSFIGMMMNVCDVNLWLHHNLISLPYSFLVYNHWPLIYKDK